MTGLWIAAGFAAWTTLAVPVAVAIGRSIRIADEAHSPYPGRHDERLVHDCARCGRRRPVHVGFVDENGAAVPPDHVTFVRTAAYPSGSPP